MNKAFKPAVLDCKGQETNTKPTSMNKAFKPAAIDCKHSFNTWEYLT